MIAGITKLELDGEIIVNESAELIVMENALLREWKVEVERPVIKELGVGRRYIDIEMECFDGVKRCGHGFVDELQTNSEEGIVSFAIMGNGKLREQERV